MKTMHKIRAWIQKKWKELDETPEWLVGKEEWGARPRIPDIYPMDFITENKPEYLQWPVRYVVIHSTLAYDDPGDDSELIKKTLREIQDDDMDESEYKDIGYNFMVGQDGKMYEGSGWKWPGAHTFDNNENSIGVAFVGDFSEKPPPENMYAVTRKLIEEGLRKGYLKVDVEVKTHAQLHDGAQCPAKRLLEDVETHKRLEPDPNFAEWAWLYSIKRLIDDSPEVVGEYVQETLKEWKLRWRHSMTRAVINYIRAN